jgi:hypothetical protein
MKRKPDGGTNGGTRAKPPTLILYFQHIRQGSLVEQRGIEPLTLSLRTIRSPN